MTSETLVNSGLLILYFNFRSTKVEGKVFLMFLFTFYKNREQVEDIPCMCMHKYTLDIHIISCTLYIHSSGCHISDPKESSNSKCQGDRSADSFLGSLDAGIIGDVGTKTD